MLTLRASRDMVGMLSHLHSAAPGELATTPDSQMRVLVVDDDPDCAEPLCDLLACLGYVSMGANSATAAIHAVDWFAPDVVLLDLMMPGDDGLALAEALRRDTTRVTPRLIAHTGYVSPSARQRATELGFEKYLVKPVDVEVLLDALGPA